MRPSVCPCPVACWQHMSFAKAVDAGEVCGMGLGLHGKDMSEKGFLHLKSKLSVLSPKSLSLYCYHTYNNKQRKEAISKSIRGSETLMVI